ncbi:MAG: AraC family transcriptional regulator [Candidatus Weimeria sp.]|nr:AraC family transcriptional regulator [Candidatus Weimeria sp.]
MAKKKKKMEFRYYDIPKGEYVLPKLGKGWEQEYGKGYDGMLHFHNYLEIGYCYHGSGRLIIEDRVYRYTDQTFTIIPANIPHTTISDEGHICKWEFLFIDIEGFVTEEMKWEGYSVSEIIHRINSRGTMKSRENHGELGRLILAIIRECRTKGPYYKEALKGWLATLAVDILRLNQEREEARRINRVNSYIRDAIEFVGTHYVEEIHISDLAEISGLSESHFRRTFEESMNMKPVEYINMVRIDKACEMIAREDVSMEDVCYRVGYQTPSTFNRNFKSLTGMTPLQWKKGGQKKGSLLSDFHITAQKGWEGNE